MLGGVGRTVSNGRPYLIYVRSIVSFGADMCLEM